MTVISEDHILGSNPVIVMVNGIKYAIQYGHIRRSAKIYKKVDSGWQYVSWVGEATLSVLEAALGKPETSPPKGPTFNQLVEAWKEQCSEDSKPEHKEAFTL